MKTLPIRIRLTLPFALVTAALLAAMSGFIYVRVGRALTASIDQNLRAQAREASARLDRRHPLLDRDSAETPTVAELLGPGGAVFASSRSHLAPAISADVRHRVLGGAAVLETRPIPGTKHAWRVLAVPVQVGGERRILVVARSLESREETLSRLVDEFLSVGPVALLLVVLGGYGLAAAALRPVEAMRRRAAAIGGTTGGARLPIPGGRDELSRLAETLNEMLDRLEGAFEHERRFVSDASHELRTPLALLTTELELALRRPRSRDELEQAIHSAAEETDRLTRLTEDLLLIARSDQGALPLRVERVCADALLRRIAQRFAPLAEERGRTVLVEAGGDELELDCDPDKVGQALANLVDNALMHGAGAVRLTQRAAGDAVEFHVGDEGAGFPPAFVARAFDRFSRADDARSSRGTGLGLAIVALVVRAHGGSAGITPTASGGADVWIALPRARPNNSSPSHLSLRSSPAV